ncbi:MAG TPA: family 16 glycoside hydrolase [Gemmataceae bacterium]|nr:family 16 glycoside hydrolase [Gemmataceae bacterium]
MGSSDEARNTKTQPDVFISYASKDADRVVPIERLLVQAGVSVWRDGDRILGGQYYGEQIVQALEHARVVLLICSPDSLASDNVHREMLVYWEYGCRAYVPIWITPAIEIPERFRYCLVGCQWIDAHAESPDVWLPRLLSALEALGVRPGAGAAPESRTAARLASHGTKKESGNAQTTGRSERQPRALQTESVAAGKRATPAAAKPRGLQLSWPILAAAMAGILIVCVVALWAAGIFRSKESPPLEPGQGTGAPAESIGRTSSKPVGESTVPKSGGFVPLFNVKDLNGWFVDSGDPGAWTVRDGELCARGRKTVFTKDPADNGYLLSERDYKNFHLSFQFQRITDGANGAVVVRAVPHETARKSMPDAKKDSPFHLSIWIGKPEDRDGTGALVWSPHSVIQPPLLPDRAAELKPLGEWDAMEIEMQGQHLRVIVNGRVVLNVMLNQTRPAKNPAPGLNRLSGRIGFMIRNGEIRFRNIEIQELGSDSK